MNILNPDEAGRAVHVADNYLYAMTKKIERERQAQWLGLGRTENLKVEIMNVGRGPRAARL